MKIATWNVNSVRKRTGNLVSWLGEAQPDIVVLQEIKAQEPQFPTLEVEAAGYKCAIVGQKGFNGVAFLSRHAFDVTAPRPARPCRGRARALRRGPGAYAARAADGGRPLPPQRQPGRHREVRLQAGVDGTATWPCPHASGARGDVRAVRRLQCLPDRDGRLRSQGVRQRCALSARIAGGIPQAAQYRPDRRGTRLPSRRRAVHVLGLPGRCLAQGPRPADRPPAAVTAGRRPADRRWHRQGGARQDRAVGSRPRSGANWTSRLKAPSSRPGARSAACRDLLSPERRQMVERRSLHSALASLGSGRDDRTLSTPRRRR